MTHEWNAKAYHEISSPQFAWGMKVLARLDLRGDEAVLDAGCGTGRLTRALLERLPRGSVVGADRSRNMLDEAAAHLAGFGGRMGYHCGDLLDLPFESEFDAVFSTATFHWVLDHPRLFAVLHRALKPGGRLVAQCGGAGNLDSMHDRAAAVMREPPYAAHFEHWRRPWEFATAEVAADRLRAAGFVDVDTNLELAPTPFPNREAFRTFLENVVLRNHLAALPTPLIQRDFLEKVVAGDGFELDYVRLNLRARRAAQPVPLTDRSE